jgi:hypothetical protein
MVREPHHEVPSVENTGPHPELVEGGAAKGGVSKDGAINPISA